MASMDSKNKIKLELCAFALKGEHNVYSLVPNIAVCMYIYIYTKSEFISSCSRPAVGSNIVQITRATFFFFKCPFLKMAFVSHFLPFQINTTIFIFVNFFYKMAAGGHFGCPKITFDRISGHFRSIRNFNFKFFLVQNGCRRPFWMSEIHFRITFLAISDQYRFFFFEICLQNGCRRPFWMSENHFRSHFWPFQIEYNFIFWEICFYKMAAVGHFGCPKFTLDHISGHFRSIQIFFF